MVIGVGTDLMEIARIAQSVDRFGERFLRRVFTPREIEYCRRKKNAAESFAARFAAKEAGAKALGTGISRGVGWLELEVTRAPGERPILDLTGRAAPRPIARRRPHLALPHPQPRCSPRRRHPGELTEVSLGARSSRRQGPTRAFSWHLGNLGTSYLFLSVT
jgi:holo-[acyl-carrier protein] synthase